MIPPSLKRIAVLAALVAGVAVVGAPAAQAAGGAKVTVMTRNLYFGTGANGLAAVQLAQNSSEYRAATTAIFRHVQATNFPARAELIADEIATAKPDLVGLQDVATWRRTPPGALSGSLATLRLFSWMASLQTALRARHAQYRVIAQKREFDFQGPTNLGFSSRLTLRSIVLAARGVKVSAQHSGYFQQVLSVPTLAGPAQFQRSFNRVDASIRGVRVRFVNTQLEPFGAGIQEAQVKELLAGPLQSRRPVILVGDLNSDRVSSDPAETVAFKVLARAGFRDATRKPSCCHDDSTLTKDDGFDHIRDHVMYKPPLRVTRTIVTGDGPRTSDGLWPSPDGGLVTDFLIPGGGRG